jgi:DNA repair exonuclease SbcCD ATPase subunit
MLHPPSLDAVHSALDPVEALRGEQSQLESWVRESTVALEALNDELTEWQRDLARRQAELDQREAALQEAEREEHCQWTDELREVRRLLRQQGSMLVSLGATLPTDEEDEAPPDLQLAAEPAPRRRS